jgi:hypothetical protein
MSEARLSEAEASEAPESEGDDGETEESQSGDAEVSEEGEDEEGEGDEEGDGRPRKAVDWEKQAHDKAGLAAKERSKRRAAERQATELAARIEALEAKGSTDTDDLAKLIEELRDDDDEPITDINQIKRVLKTIMARQQAARQAEGQQRQTEQAVRKISTGMEAFEADFAEEHPDYIKAATYYRNARVSELEDLGYSGERLMQKVAGEFFTMVNDVMKSGRDPAEVVYNLAKKRGFATGKDEATKKLQKMQAAGGTAGAPRSKGQDNGLTWERVAKATGAEKDRLWAKLRAQELGKK